VDRRRDLRRTILQLGLGLTSVVAALLVAEMLVRGIAPQRIRTPFAIDDPRLLYRNEPLIHGRHTSPGEFDYRFSINSKGCRGRETTWKKLALTKRVVCVGDSFTWGTGVEYDQCYPAQLEQLLNAEAVAGNEPHYEVINTGVMSWGISQYYLCARGEALRYEPDVVVVSMFQDDWENALLGLITEDNAGHLIEHEVTFPQLRKQRLMLSWIPFFRQIMSHSELANLIQDALRARVTWPPATGSFLKPDSTHRMRKAKAPSEAPAQRAIRLTQKMILELDRSCRRAGCLLLVLWIPDRISVESALHPALVERPSSEQQVVYSKVGHTLQGFCEEHEVLFVDATTTFVRLCDEQHRDPVSFYFKRDGHFRAEGYRELAQLLVPYVKPSATQE